MSITAASRAEAVEPGRLVATLRSQMPVLDALRGVAIALVLVHRFNVTPDPVSLPARLACAFMDGGWVGVQLFFVLSGFLITGILLDSRDGATYYRSFYARRTLRIFPLYYGVLAATFVVMPLFTGRQATGAEHQLWLWTYVANWVQPFGLGVAAFPHFWSLGVEEQFYLVWPFVVRVARGRALPIVCALLVVLAVASRVVVRRLQLDLEVPYMWTICRVDALALGAMAAWALRVPSLARAIEGRQRALAAGTIALFLAGSVVTHGYPRQGLSTQTIGYTLIAWLAVVALVLAVLAEVRGGRVASLLSPAPLRSLGKYSYGMYVFHAPLHRALGERLLARFGQVHPDLGVTLVYATVMSAITYGVAVASYHLYEKHFLALKRRFPVARAATS